MANLSAAGNQLVQDLSNRYGVSTDAVEHMLVAVHNGNGSMAQFSHPEFGGSGQWMRGGMTMVSDLFNTQLKYLVDNVCNDLSNGLAAHQANPFSGSFQSQSQNGAHFQAQTAGQMGGQNSLFIPDPSTEWWPRELGRPSAIGSQNSARYAYFSGSRRLAVTTGGKPWVYDTLDHQIGGFGQQQGGGQSITFTSQYGTVNLSTLPVVVRDGAPVKAETINVPEPSTPPVVVAQTQSTDTPNHHSPPQDSSEVISLLEKLGQLMEKGFISEEEFASKKSELLGRL